MSVAQSCLHCKISRTRETIPRPLVIALHGFRPNKVVHISFLYMGESEHRDAKYLLLVKDDMSGYSWLKFCASADRDKATQAVKEWIAEFRSMTWLVSDQGARFTAALMKTLADEARIQHHFTTVCCPSAGVTTERLCKEVLWACRALLSEWKLRADEWPSIISCIQSILNLSPLRRVITHDSNGTHRTPLECFTGLEPTPLQARPAPLLKFKDYPSLCDSMVKAIIDIQSLQKAMN